MKGRVEVHLLRIGLLSNTWLWLTSTWIHARVVATIWTMLLMPKSDIPGNGRWYWLLDFCRLFSSLLCFSAQIALHEIESVLTGAAVLFITIVIVWVDAAGCRLHLCPGQSGRLHPVRCCRLCNRDSLILFWSITLSRFCTSRTLLVLLALSNHCFCLLKGVMLCLTLFRIAVSWTRHRSVYLGKLHREVVGIYVVIQATMMMLVVSNILDLFKLL